MGLRNSYANTRLFLLTLICAPMVFGADTVVQEIIARVNNQIITRTEFARSQEDLRPMRGQTGLTPIPIAG